MHLFTGKPPYMANTERELVAKLRSHAEADAPTYPRTLTPALRNLLRCMLTKDPKVRATLSSVMTHEWVTDEGTEPLPRTTYVRIETHQADDDDDDDDINYSNVRAESVQKTAADPVVDTYDPPAAGRPTLQLHGATGASSVGAPKRTLLEEGRSVSSSVLMGDGALHGISHPGSGSHHDLLLDARHSTLQVTGLGGVLPLVALHTEDSDDDGGAGPVMQKSHNVGTNHPKSARRRSSLAHSSVGLFHSASYVTVAHPQSSTPSTHAARAGHHHASMHHHRHLPTSASSSLRGIETSTPTPPRSTSGSSLSASVNPQGTASPLASPQRLANDTSVDSEQSASPHDGRMNDGVAGEPASSPQRLHMQRHRTGGGHPRSIGVSVSPSVGNMHRTRSGRSGDGLRRADSSDHAGSLLMTPQRGDSTLNRHLDAGGATNNTVTMSRAARTGGGAPASAAAEGETGETVTAAGGALKKAHLQHLRQRQLALLRGHAGLPPSVRDVLMEQQRFAIHEARALAVVEEIELFDAAADKAETAAAAAMAAVNVERSSPHPSISMPSEQAASHGDTAAAHLHHSSSAAAVGTIAAATPSASRLLRAAPRAIGSAASPASFAHRHASLRVLSPHPAATTASMTPRASVTRTAETTAEKAPPSLRISVHRPYLREPSVAYLINCHSGAQRQLRGQELCAQTTQAPPSPEAMPATSAWKHVRERRFFHDDDIFHNSSSSPIAGMLFTGSVGTTAAAIVAAGVGAQTSELRVMSAQGEFYVPPISSRAGSRCERSPSPSPTPLRIGTVLSQQREEQHMTLRPSVNAPGGDGDAQRLGDTSATPMLSEAMQATTMRAESDDRKRHSVIRTASWAAGTSSAHRSIAASPAAKHGAAEATLRRWGPSSSLIYRGDASGIAAASPTSFATQAHAAGHSRTSPRPPLSARSRSARHLSVSTLSVAPAISSSVIAAPGAVSVLDRKWPALGSAIDGHGSRLARPWLMTEPTRYSGDSAGSTARLLPSSPGAFYPPSFTSVDAASLEGEEEAVTSWTPTPIAVKDDKGRGSLLTSAPPYRTSATAQSSAPTALQPSSGVAAIAAAAPPHATHMGPAAVPVLMPAVVTASQVAANRDVEPRPYEGDLAVPALPNLPPPASHVPRTQQLFSFTPASMAWRLPRLESLPDNLLLPLILSRLPPARRAAVVLVLGCLIDTERAFVPVSVTIAAGLTDSMLATALPPAFELWKHVNAVVACASLPALPAAAGKLPANNVANSDNVQAGVGIDGGVALARLLDEVGLADSFDRGLVLAGAEGCIALPQPCEVSEEMSALPTFGGYSSGASGTPLFLYHWQIPALSESAEVESAATRANTSPRTQATISASSAGTTAAESLPAVESLNARRIAAPTASLFPSRAPTAASDAALAGRKLTRHEDFVMVTAEQLGGGAPRGSGGDAAHADGTASGPSASTGATGGNWKKAVIFRARPDTGGSLSLANPHRGVGAPANAAAVPLSHVQSLRSLAMMGAVDGTRNAASATGLYMPSSSTVSAAKRDTTTSQVAPASKSSATRASGAVASRARRRNIENLAIDSTVSPPPQVATAVPSTSTVVIQLQTEDDLAEGDDAAIVVVAAANHDASRVATPALLSVADVLDRDDDAIDAALVSDSGIAYTPSASTASVLASTPDAAAAAAAAAGGANEIDDDDPTVARLERAFAEGRPASRVLLGLSPEPFGSGTDRDNGASKTRASNADGTVQGSVTMLCGPSPIEDDRSRGDASVTATSAGARPPSASPLESSSSSPFAGSPTRDQQRVVFVDDLSTPRSRRRSSLPTPLLRKSSSATIGAVAATTLIKADAGSPHLHVSPATPGASSDTSASGSPAVDRAGGDDTEPLPPPPRPWAGDNNSLIDSAVQLDSSAERLRMAQVLRTVRARSDGYALTGGHTVGAILAPDVLSRSSAPAASTSNFGSPASASSPGSPAPSLLSGGRPRVVGGGRFSFDVYELGRDEGARRQRGMRRLERDDGRNALALRVHAPVSVCDSGADTMMTPVVANGDASDGAATPMSRRPMLSLTRAISTPPTVPLQQSAAVGSLLLPPGMLSKVSRMASVGGPVVSTSSAGTDANVTVPVMSRSGSRADSLLGRSHGSDCVDEVGAIDEIDELDNADGDDAIGDKAGLEASDGDESDMESDFGSLLDGGNAALEDVTDQLDTVLAEALAPVNAIDEEIEPLDDVVESPRSDAKSRAGSTSSSDSDSSEDDVMTDASDTNSGERVAHVTERVQPAAQPLNVRRMSSSSTSSCSSSSSSSSYGGLHGKRVPRVAASAKLLGRNPFTRTEGDAIATQAATQPPPESSVPLALLGSSKIQLQGTMRPHSAHAARTTLYEPLGATVIAPAESRSALLALAFGVAEDCGRRSSMEDRVMAVIDMGSALRLDHAAPPQAYFGVYDGHNGPACAETLARRLHYNLTRADGFAEDPAAALVRAFLRTDRAFLRRQIEMEHAAREAEAAAAAAGQPPPRDDFRFSGATAIAMLVRLEPVESLEVRDGSTASSSPSTSDRDDLVVHGSEAVTRFDEDRDEVGSVARRRHRGTGATMTPPMRPRLYIAHCGDCRAVLSHAGRALELTSDHKPSTRPDEVARIVSAGGWVHNGRLHGVLAVSRAFGDAEHKVLKDRFWDGAHFTSDPLIVEPDVRVHTVRPRDEFVVLASDGLWDVMTSQMVVNFVRRKLRDHHDVQRASEQLVQKALALSSVDNVSAFVVVLNARHASPS